MIKDFKDCYLYSLTNNEGYSAEKQLFTYVNDTKSTSRINKASTAFQPIRAELKSRATSAVIYRVLAMDNVKLCISNQKELPASFKVFRAMDRDKTPSIFVDCTGLIQVKDNMFVCREIDKLATYLMGAMVFQLYYNYPDKLTRDGVLQKLATSCFIKMICAEFDNARIKGYIENKQRIQYITGVYFAYSVMGLDINSAHNISAAAIGINTKIAKEFDFWYNVEDLKNIDTFITLLCKNFKMEDFKTSNFIGQWVWMYGKGTMYATELYPVFLNMIIYAYSGTYVNNLKRIETVLGRDMVALTTHIIKIGTETFSKGFKYESGDREYFDNQTSLIKEQNPIKDEVDPKTITKKETEDKKEQNNFSSIVNGDDNIKFDTVFKKDSSIIATEQVNFDFINDYLLEASNLSAQDIENIVIGSEKIKPVYPFSELTYYETDNIDIDVDAEKAYKPEFDSYEDKEDATNDLDSIVDREFEEKGEQSDTSTLSDGEEIKPENN